MGGPLGGFTPPEHFNKPKVSKIKGLANGKSFYFGAGDGARTRYLHLGKVALYQMSYARRTKWIIADVSRFVNRDFQFFANFSPGKKGSRLRRLPLHSARMFSQNTPCSIMASATFLKPARLAPATRL